jgi:hypothetical protein
VSSLSFSRAKKLKRERRAAKTGKGTASPLGDGASETTIGGFF